MNMTSATNKDLWAKIAKEVKVDKKQKKPETPPIKATSNNKALDTELLMTAIEACIAQDQLKELEVKARKAKSKLYALMKVKNIQAIVMPDRNDIEIKNSTSRKTTKRSLKETYGDEMANFIWELFPKESSSYLSIPKKHEQDEPENL